MPTRVVTQPIASPFVDCILVITRKQTVPSMMANALVRTICHLTLPRNTVMKRRVPNRRRLFVQNLENRRVLAGCMGVDAATDDLATEEVAEVASAVAGSTIKDIDSAAIESATEATDELEDSVDSTVEEQDTANDETSEDASLDQELDQDDASTETEGDPGHRPHPRRGPHHPEMTSDALNADTMGEDGGCADEDTEADTTETIDETDSLSDESTDDLATDETDVDSELVDDKEADEIVEEEDATLVSDLDSEASDESEVTDESDSSDETESTDETDDLDEATETASETTVTDVDSVDTDDTEDEDSSLCLIHEELDSIFAELGSRDLADAQIYILI